MAEPGVVTMEFALESVDNERLANLCGTFDEHLRQIERVTGVTIMARGGVFRVDGEDRAVKAVSRLLEKLYQTTDQMTLTPEEINLQLQEMDTDSLQEARPDQILIKTRRGMVKGRGPNQNGYLKQIHETDITFGIGPAGTGKTYLAVASAVDALQHDRVERLVLVRPAVEAGERLGFLPGDLVQKVDPYLRPLYDALYEMLGFDRVTKLIDRNVIEIAPLAFMRGRTLNDAFIILDEAQNTSVEQMKMFLTRIGFGSRAVITGDVTQIDLPKNQQSGLAHAIQVLKQVDGISFTFFDAKDVVRHRLVKRIVQAYAAAKDSDT
ncbi:MAG: PhoH family protein [Xanthomonadales bacterium]|nr:PhoH family protein [Xanthomonadales bacterium]